MATITRIEELAITKLNNAEYAEFCQKTFENMINAGYPKLGITKALFDEFGNNKNLMSDIVSQSRTSDETVKIDEADAKCDHALHFLLGTIEAGRYSTVEADRQAYVSLYNLTKPYRGIQNLPRRQQIAQTRGMVRDMEKAQYAPMVSQLGLVMAIQALDRANEDYAELIGKRAGEQVANELPAGREIRVELDALYHEVIAVAFAESVAKPTEFTAQFVTAQNKLIHDTRTAYNQRMGLMHYWKDKKEEQEKAETEAVTLALADEARHEGREYEESEEIRKVEEYEIR